MYEQPVKRCAVYTRKSCEDGLELDYNSLEAQYDAASAYIKSQAGNGWQLIPKRYDDGGFSGGNVMRPALRELLKDIEAHLVDVVVVYKIDRLSRSLCDFTDLSRLFEKNNVSFVSVTQQIDTSNAAGRMMLNILMSFSQFEREMTADRIRDKISATKRKGMWVGGPVPLGYKAVNKQLAIDHETEPIVKYVFSRYAETGSCRTVALELQQKFGGRKFNFRGHDGSAWRLKHVRKIIRNVVYKGYVMYHRTGEVFKGIHEPIIEEALWDDCQRIMNETASRQPRSHEETTAILKGVIRCGHCGGAMAPVFTEKRKGVRYSYYRCVASTKRLDVSCPLKSISGGLIEKEVINQLGVVLGSPEFIRLAAKDAGCGESEVKASLSNVSEFFESLFPPERERLVKCLIEEVVVRTDGIDIEFKTSGMGELIKEMTNGNNQEDA